MDEFQEFPKVIFLGGNPSAECRVVFSADEEALAEGYAVASFEEKPEEPAKRKPGRPRKEAD